VTKNVSGHHDVASLSRTHDTGFFVFSTSTPVEFHCTSNRLISLFNTTCQATHDKANNNFGITIVCNNV